MIVVSPRFTRPGVRPQAGNSDRASNENFAGEKAFALLYSGDVAHGLQSVFARPSLRRKQCIQAIGVREDPRTLRSGHVFCRWPSL